MTSQSSVQYTRSEPIEGEDLYSGAVTVGSNQSTTPLIFLISILFFTVIQNQDLDAQRKSDIGIFAGTSYYMGDLNPSTHFYSPSVAIGPIYRYNIHTRSAVRFSGIYHRLTANDPDFNNSAGASFATEFIDLAASFEFNFLPYKTNNRKMKYSLYTAAGIGYNILLTGDPTTPEPTSSHFTIPFSLGFKFNAGKRLSAGIEWSPRKTFKDNAIDGITNIGELNSEFHLLGNNDWYTFAGVFITYKIFNYREDCPTYDD
ncbi:MAG: DUF6089 family protein [Bacteroidales bacterium]